MEGRLKSGPREGDLAAGYHDIGAISLYVLSICRELFKGVWLSCDVITVLL